MARLFLSTLPKSGTHILGAFLNAAGLERYRVEDDAYRTLANVIYRYEINDDLINRLSTQNAIFKELHIFNKADFVEQLDLLRRKTLESLLDMPDGHYVYHHYVYDPLLVEEIHRAGIPIAFLYRDPRDYIVSFNNHVLRHQEHKHHRLFNEMNSDQERFLTIIRGSRLEEGFYEVTPLEIIFQSMRGWIDDQRVLSLRFEEIIGPKGLGNRYLQYDCFDRLMKHAGFEIDAEELYRCADSSYSEKHSLFVKGQIGQWKELFSREALNELESLAGGLVRELGFEESGLSKARFNAHQIDDVNRLWTCLERAEDAAREERSESGRLRARIEELTEEVRQIESDSVKRLELINEHQKRIKELEAQNEIRLELVYKHQGRIGELESIYAKAEVENQARLELVFKHERTIAEMKTWTGLCRLIASKALNIFYKRSSRVIKENV